MRVTERLDLLCQGHTNPEMEGSMAHLYFHCSGPGEVLVDHHGTSVSSLSEARDHALAIARFIIDGAFGIESFSEWKVYVGTEDDEEVLVVPFACLTPTLH